MPTDISTLIARRADAIEREKGFSISEEELPGSAIYNDEQTIADKLTDKDDAETKQQLVKLYTKIYADGDEKRVEDRGVIGSRGCYALIIKTKKGDPWLWIKYATKTSSAKEIKKNNLGISELNSRAGLEATLTLSYGPLHTLSIYANRTADAAVKSGEIDETVSKIEDLCKRYFFNRNHINQEMQGQQRKELEFILDIIEGHANKMENGNRGSLLKFVKDYKADVNVLAAESEPVTWTTYDFQLSNLLEYDGKLYINDLGVAYDNVTKAQETGYKLMWGNPAFALGVMAESVDQIENPQIASVFKEKFELLANKFVDYNQWPGRKGILAWENRPLKQVMYELGRTYITIQRMRTRERTQTTDSQKLGDLISSIRLRRGLYNTPSP